MQEGNFVFTSLDDLQRMLEKDRKRPKNQWWLELRPVARVLARPGPSMPGYEG
jgi:6-phosphofructokinase 1